MYLSVNGNDLTKYIAAGGIQWQRNDIDGSNAGRVKTGLMYRDRVTTKIKLTITTIPLKGSDFRKLLNAIEPEYVSVTYDDPQMGRRTAQFYSNNVTGTAQCRNTDGVDIWDSITFPLVER